jgi:uncharacterized protein YebE (UPF0316 family)
MEDFFVINGIGLDWLLIPVAIFLAETCVVTLSTVRILFVGRGMKLLAAGLGFLEVTLWLLAIGQVMANLSSVGCYAAFGLGFALGNYLGICIEQRLAIGTLVIRIITSRDASELRDAFKAANYGVTVIHGRGANGPVQVVFTVIKRKDLKDAIGMIEKFHPKAFYSVEDQREANEGVFPEVQAGPLGFVRRVFRRAA